MNYRPCRPDDDAAVRVCIGSSLNISAAVWPDLVRRIGPENLRVVEADGAVVAGMAAYRMGQWFGGRSVPCAGVTIVGVAAEHRRKGAAGLMLREMLRELHAAGEPIAALYASTQGLYRGVDFEQAGSRCLYDPPLTPRSINRRELPGGRVDLGPWGPAGDVARRRGMATNGNLDRTPGLWERITSMPDRPHVGYIFGSLDAPEGYLISYHDQLSPESARIVVRDMAALTPAAARRLWTLLADHASYAGSVRWVGPPSDPLLALPAECKHTPIQLLRWMLRIVRVPEALESRGYAPAAAGELHLDLRDDLLPENSGRWVVRISDGAATVTPGGRGDLTLPVRSLAPLYSGFLTASELRQLGWLEGPDAVVQMADQLFAGPAPWMPEIF